MSASSQPAVTNPGSGSDPASGPRQVMNVAVLAESELGSEAQREDPAWSPLSLSKCHLGRHGAR